MPCPRPPRRAAQREPSTPAAAFSKAVRPSANDKNLMATIATSSAVPATHGNGVCAAGEDRRRGHARRGAWACLTRILLRFPCDLAVALALPAKRTWDMACKRAYFRVTSGACVLSPYVAWQARLGNNVRIGMRVVVGRDVAIGDYTYVNQDSYIDSGRIGKFCSIAARVSIGPFEHPTRWFSTHPGTYGEPAWGLLREPVALPEKQPPTIGNDVWIGRNAFVLRGVSVGDGAIIGAGAVVTRDVPPYAIVAGVPAKVVTYRFSPNTIERLLRVRWWDDPSVMQSLIEAGTDCAFLEPPSSTRVE